MSPLTPLAWPAGYLCVLPGGHLPPRTSPGANRLLPRHQVTAFFPYRVDYQEPGGPADRHGAGQVQGAHGRGWPPDDGEGGKGGAGRGGACAHAPWQAPLLGLMHTCTMAGTLAGAHAHMHHGRHSCWGTCTHAPWQVPLLGLMHTCTMAGTLAGAHAHMHHGR